MRALILSDTHNQHHLIELPKTKYSIAIHTGDFSNSGSEKECDDFLVWYSELPCRHKILVAGNHDKYAFYKNDRFKIKCALLGITYLEDESIEIDGIAFHGSPWVTQFGNWAFMDIEKRLQLKWDLIPRNTNVLLTHGPALWHLDKVERGHVGSSTLGSHIDNNLPALILHIFGHIHECNQQEVKTRKLRRINASCVDKYYNLCKPRVININLK